MLLCVDIGNTQTVLGLYHNDKLLAHWRIATETSDTADALAVRVEGLFSLASFGSLSSLDDVAIASVVPPLTAQWQALALRIAGVEPLVLSANLDSGLAIAYANPSEIGADRIADAVAALARYGAPCVVVDLGTATNIEVIDRTGAFLGGIIAPGLVTSAEALFAAAARLSKIDIEVPEQAIGRTTREAVQSGLCFGEADRIDGLVRRIWDELGYPTHVIATGGLAERIAPLSQTIEAVDPMLTLEGLRLVHARIRGASTAL